MFKEKSDKIVIAAVLILVVFILSSCSEGNIVGRAIEKAADDTLEEPEPEEQGPDALTEKFNSMVMGVDNIDQESESQEEIVEVTEETEEQESTVAEEETEQEETVTEDTDDDQETPEEKDEEQTEQEEVDPFTIKMKNSAFDPGKVIIPLDTELSFENDDTKLHVLNMYFGDEFDGNIRLDSGETFIHKFNNEGTFKIQDAILLDQMRMEVVVE